MVRRVSFCALFWLGSMGAQDSSFHVQTKVMQAPVSVTGKDGRRVDGLVARDFSVLDDGVRQSVTVDDFSTGLPRISLAIAIQTSEISTPALTSICHIGNMIQLLAAGPRGEAAVLPFESRIRWCRTSGPMTGRSTMS